MGNFNNEHLDNLWTNVVPYLGGMCTTSEIVKLVKLFRECDTAIENEADDCEHWRTMYGKTCKEVDMLKESISLRDRVIDKFRTTKTAVEKERDEYKSQLEDLYKFLGKWRDPNASDDFEDIQELKDENARLKESLDIQKKSNEALLSANMDLAREKHKLEDSLSYTMIQQLEAHVEELTEQLKDANDKVDCCANDLDDAKKQLDYFTHSRNDWRARAKHAEDEVENLKKDYEKLFGENKKLKARTDCLRYEAEWYRKHYKELSAKIGELKSRLNSMYGVKYGEYVRSRDTGYKNGQTDLWDMLQNVNDAKPFELAACFQDVSCMADILSWDLEDFLVANKSWQEKNEQDRIKYMRDYLGRFCAGRKCHNCPLLTDDFECGRGKWFYDMTYEELKRHYEKARGCCQCLLNRKDD